MELSRRCGCPGHEFDTDRASSEHMCWNLRRQQLQTNVKILAVHNGDGKDEHLELVFGDNQETHANAARLEKNTEYGRLHAKEE